MKTLIKNIFGRISYNIGILLIKKRNTSFKSILVLAPHPDDEIIGLGGLVLQTLKNNGQVYITYLTDGKNSGASANKNEIKKQRIRLSEQVINKLNINPENISRLHLPDGEVPFSEENRFKETVNKIKLQIESIKPDAIFATAKSDYWPFDHVACSQIAKEAIKTSTFKSELWFYWIWTWYHLKPWHLLKLNFKKLNKIDVTEELSEKQKLIEIYLNAYSQDGLPWSGMLPKSMIHPFSKEFEIIEKFNG